MRQTHTYGWLALVAASLVAACSSATPASDSGDTLVPGGPTPTSTGGDSGTSPTHDAGIPSTGDAAPPPTTTPSTPSPPSSGTIGFHLLLGVSGSDSPGDSIKLDGDNYTDLI